MRLHKGKKWIYISLLFTFVMSICMPLTAFAQNTILTATVPSEFLLKIEIDGKGEVQIGEKHFSETTTISVKRHTKTAIRVVPAVDYEIESVSYNGEAMTENFQSDTLTLTELTGDSVLSITFAKKTPPPQTGDNQYLLYLCFIVMVFSALILVWLTIKRDKIH